MWGKLFGVMAGFALGGPLGALAGAFAGHGVDKLREGGEPPLGPPPGQAARQAAFAVAVIVLGAKIAKVDGRVSSAEVAAFKQVFRVSPSDKAKVGRIFNLAKRDAGGFEPYARQIAALFRGQPEVLEELLAGLFYIARADGDIGPAKLAFLREVAAIFGLAPAAFEGINAGLGPQAEGDPYTVLGVRGNATSDEIKAAYRKLIREHHPDVLVAKGMPAEFIQVANQRMAAINAAYDRIEKMRGMR